MAVSRAVWLIQALQLNKVQPQHATQRRQSLLSPPSTPMSLRHTKEETQIVWSVFMLDCFLSICLGFSVMDTIIQNEVLSKWTSRSYGSAPLTFSLQVDLELPQTDVTNSVYLRVVDVLKRSYLLQISPEQGLDIAIFLCNRTIQYIKRIAHADPFDRNPYNFWTQHYHLDEAIGYIAKITSMGRIDGPAHGSEDGSIALMIRLLLKATVTCLHEASLTKADAEVSAKGASKLVMPAQSSEALSLQNSLDIADLVQTSISREATTMHVFLP